MRLSSLNLTALSLHVLMGCATLNRVETANGDRTASGRSAHLRLQAEGTEPWVVFVCREEQPCAFFGVFRPGQKARIRWQDGDFLVVADGTESVYTPDAEGRTTDDLRCTRPFTGEAQVETSSADGTLVATRHLRVANGRAECQRRYVLAEAGRNVMAHF